MAAYALALYNTPSDPAAFERYYAETHAPLAKTLPGLRSYTISTGALTLPPGSPPYHLVAVLTFDSPAALGAALESPEGKAVVADLANFATGGVSVITFEALDL